MLTFRAALLVLAVGMAAPAWATQEDPWGKLEGAMLCKKDPEYARLERWHPTTLPEKLSAACKSELRARVERCLQDPESQRVYKDKKYLAYQDPSGYCAEVVGRRLGKQVARYEELGAQRVPKADVHDARIEKAIAAAYHLAHPENEILMVIITNRQWEMERSATGRIIGRDISAAVVSRHPDAKCEILSEQWGQPHNGTSFAGPFAERREGAHERVEILCENVN